MPEATPAAKRLIAALEEGTGLPLRMHGDLDLRHTTIRKQATLALAALNGTKEASDGRK